MKGSFLMLMLLSVSLCSLAQWVPVDSISEVRFKIRNLGFTVNGSFKGLEGDVQFDPSSPAASSFHVSIDANTINTGIEMRDDHLRSSGYFDTKNYPRIHFVSDRITSTGKPGTFFVSGKLTIKNVSRNISFPFSATVHDGGYLFNGEFRIRRKDYQVGGGGNTIADNVTVLLSVFARKL